MIRIISRTKQTKFSVVNLGELVPKMQSIAVDELNIPRAEELKPKDVSVSVQEVYPFDSERDDISFKIEADANPQLSMNLYEYQKKIRKRFRKMIPKKFSISVWLTISQGSHGRA